MITNVLYLAQHSLVLNVQKRRKIQSNGKKKVRIDCLDMVKQYNAAMGGVDLADMLNELYRTKIVTRKR